MRETEILKQLEKLDLNQQAARVYLSLLKLGDSNAGPIIRGAELHRQQVYKALEKLESLRLVGSYIRNNRKVFQAAPPDSILKLQEERERVAVNLVPELRALLPANQDRIAVQVLYGEQEFVKNLLTVLQCAARADGIVRIIGGARDDAFYQALGGRYNYYAKEARKLRVKKYLLAPDPVSAKFKQTFAQEPGNKLRLQNIGLSSPTYTRITPELTTIEVYGPEIVVIQIWNRAIARGYREHFDLLWAQARPYELDRN